MYTTPSRYRHANRDVTESVSWRMVSDDQCDELFNAAAELLERSGIRVDSQSALNTLSEGGCSVKGEIVRIPTSRLEWAVRTAPSRITLCKRNGRRAIQLQAKNIHLGSPLYAPELADQKSGALRPTTSADQHTLMQLGNQLENIDFLTLDARPEAADSNLISRSEKPLLIRPRNAEQAQELIKQAADGSQGLDNLRLDPHIMLVTGSPLTRVLDQDSCGIIMACASTGLPLCFLSDLIAGQTSPGSPAGTIVAALAASLTALLLAQLVCEGTPFAAGGRFGMPGSRPDRPSYSAPEGSLISAGYVNVLNFLKIPSAAFGGSSSSSVSDARYGAESTFSLTSAAFSGANLILNGGSLADGRILSPACLTIADEVMGQLRRIASGIETDEDRIASGLYDLVQPGGYYLDQEHTAMFFQSEQYWPLLMNRKPFESWVSEGSRSLGQRAADRADTLLQESGSDENQR